MEEIKYLIEDKKTRYYLKEFEGENYQMTDEVFDARMSSDKEHMDALLERLDCERFEVVEHMFYYK